MFGGTILLLAAQEPRNMLSKFRRWVGRFLAALGLAVLLVVVTPSADYLAQSLRLEAELRSAQAIVVLGGGAYRDGLPSMGSLARAVYGLSLLRAGYAPRLLLAGGRARPDAGLESVAMKKLLEGIGASEKILETEELSTRTYSNAVECARILKPQGATQILLVTHPMHMLRAKLAFEKVGFTVYPAPIPWDRLPTGSATSRLGRIGLLYNVFYEYGGLILYWWRGWL